MVSAALLLVLTAQQPAHLLILGGGKRPEDAHEVKAKFESADGVKPAEGFPKVVKSDDIPGLNPGFHILVLGACKPDEWRLDAIRAFYDKSYIRPVKWKGALPCPKLDRRWKLGKPNEHVFGKKKKQKKIRVRRAGTDAVVAELIGGDPVQGRLVITSDSLRKYGQAGCEIGKDRVDKNVLVVDFGCHVPDCTTLGHQAGQVRIGIRKNRLTANIAEGKYTPGKCD